MFYFLTARAHVSETQIFEDYLKILLPFITTHENYHYSIEKDDTCDRHIHVLLEDKAKDMNAFQRKLDTKNFKVFWEHIKDKLSVKDQLTFTKIVKPDEVKETIGYIFKDVNSRQGSSKFTDKAYIQECVELYWTMKRLKEKKKDENYVDVKIVTTKNFYSRVQEFCNKTLTRYDDDHLLYKMKKAGHGFINISRKQKQEGFRELRIIKNQEKIDEEIQVKSEMYEHIDEEKQELEEDLLTLLFATNEFEYNLERLRKKYNFKGIKVDPNKMIY